MKRKFVQIAALCLSAVLLALCAAGAVAGKLYLDRTSGGEPSPSSGSSRVAKPRQSHPMESGNYFGEEDQSDK